MERKYLLSLLMILIISSMVLGELDVIIDYEKESEYFNNALGLENINLDNQTLDKLIERKKSDEENLNKIIGLVNLVEENKKMILVDDLLGMNNKFLNEFCDCEVLDKGDNFIEGVDSPIRIVLRDTEVNEQIQDYLLDLEKEEIELYIDDSDIENLFINGDKELFVESVFRNV